MISLLSTLMFITMKARSTTLIKEFTNPNVLERYKKPRYVTGVVKLRDRGFQASICGTNMVIDNIERRSRAYLCALLPCWGDNDGKHHGYFIPYKL